MAWSRLQSAHSAVGFGNATATFGSNLTAGSTMIAVAITEGTGFTTSGVADPSSNAFVKMAAQALGGTRGEISLWALNTPAGDAGTAPGIKMTASGGTNSLIFIQEVSGLATGATLAALMDGTPGGWSGSVNNNGTTTNPTYSSTAASEYLVSAATGSTLSFSSGPAGMTQDANELAASGGNFGVYFAYANSTNGAETAVWTRGAVGGADQAGTILGAFKLSSTAHTATASLTVTPSFTAVRVRGHSRTTSLTVTPSRTAAAARGHARTAALTVTPARTAARRAAHVATAALTVTPARTAARTAARVRTATRAVTPAVTAAAAKYGQFTVGALTSSSAAPATITSATGTTAAPITSRTDP